VDTRTLLLSGCIAAAALTSGRAGAMGAIVTSPPGDSSITDVRVAVSSTGTRTSRWVSLRVHGSATAFAWILPVKSSAFVDLASDAWLEALEDATSPRVVPPDAAPTCGAGGVETDGDITHAVTTAPDAVATAADEPTLAATLAGWGLPVTADLAPMLDAAAADGDSFVALRYSDVPPDTVTRTVRIVDAFPASIPLALTAGASTVAVTAYAFTTGPAEVGTAPPLILSPALLVWGDDGTSTYAGVLDAVLTESPGAWLIETAGPGLLFQGEPVPAGGAVPALTPAYFSRAWTYGDASGSPDECTAAATALATRTGAMAVACPAGSLLRVGAPSCDESVGEGEVSPDALRCGGISDDLAMALSGVAPAAAWLTRARSVLAPATPGANAALGSAGPDAPPDAPVGPVVTCTRYDDPCGANEGGATPPPAAGSPGSGTGSSSGARTDDPGGGSNIGSAVGTVASAALDSDNSDQGCGGDSSDDSGDSCDGDTSGDDAGGDGCSGSSAPTSDDCALAGRSGGSFTHSRRGPASRLLVLLVAFAAVARRRQRS
jgi:hypothetical protein